MLSDVMVRAAGLVFVETVVLAAIVLLADRLMPARFVRERHDLAVAAIFMVPVLFALTFLPALTGGSALSETVAAPAVVQELRAAVAVAAPVAVQTKAMVPAAAAPVWPSVALGLLALWAFGTAVMLVRLGLALRGLLALVSRAEPVRLPAGMRLSRDVEVRRSSEVSAPMLAGYLRPVILIQDDFAFDQDALPVLEHEVAHAVRGDNWVALALRAVTAVFWWNAMLYAMMPLVSAAREKLCDSRAAIVTGAPTALARALLDTAVRALRKPAPALAATAHGSALAERVRRLASPDATATRRPAVTVQIALPVLAAVALFAAPQVGLAQQAGGWEVYSADRSGDADDPLYRAAYHGRLDETVRLIEAGANPSRISQGDGTALMAAARGGHLDVLTALLDAGADPNTVVPGDGTALIAAARYGRDAMVAALLEAGADPDLSVEGDGAALITAAHWNRVSIVDQLLAAGADVNLAVPRDGNPLISAALAGHADMAQRLLDAGADPNGYVFRDETPLINAAQQGHVDVAEVLVAAGADVSLTVETPAHDPGGSYRSPLSEAERNEHEAMVRWLRDRGAEHRPGE